MDFKPLIAPIPQLLVEFRLISSGTDNECWQLCASLYLDLGYGYGKVITVIESVVLDLSLPAASVCVHGSS